MRCRTLLQWIAVIVALPVLVACGGNYYRVTDPASGHAYYTRDIDHEKGHVRFTDQASGDKVTLDSFEVRELSRQQYRDAIGK